MPAAHWLRRGFPTLLLALVVGCGGGPRRANVLLVTFDTTRADHIGAYGNPRASTPNVDRLASEGLLFTHAHASIPLTFPSHTTILTGLYPTGHGIRDNGLFVLSDDIVTLPELLQAAGYATAGVISGFPLVERFNLGQGFDLFDDELRRKDEDFLGRRPRQPSLYFEERQAGRTNEAILPWLDEHAGRPFFVWLHYYDPHRPWDPPPPYDQLYADDPYLGEIAYTDESLGVVLDRLRELEVFDDTLVIMTSDHGEGLGEHNESTHSLLNYQSTLRVPLVVRPPGGMEARRIDDLVAGVDIAPTVLDLLGIEPPAPLHGHSLAGYLTGGGGVPANRQVYAETLSPRLSHGWGEIRTLYQGDHKYLHGARSELYDLSADPDELRDLLAVERELAGSMEAALGRMIADNAMTTADAQPVDEETRAQLMALGYISGGAESGPILEELRTDGTPPQERVVDINLSSEVRSLLSSGRGSSARQVALELLERDPANAFYRELLVQAAMMLGRLDEVEAVLGSLIAEPRGRGASAGVLTAAGSRLVRAGRIESGLAFLERAVALDSGAQVQYQLASARRQAGDHEGEYDALLATLDADAGHVPARVDVAIRLAVGGERALAREAFEEALEQDPFYTKGHYNYGTFLLETGAHREALERFKRAVRIDPSYRAAHLAIVHVEVELGNLEGAGRALEQLERIAPESKESERARRLVAANGTS